jgi:hypothetical protein
MAEYEKTLRWLEPYGGWHENDTGLCNRIFHWEVAFELSRHNNYEYQILLQRKYWPELSLIELPQTKVYTSTEGDSYNIDFLKFRTVYDTINNQVSLSKELNLDEVEYMFKNRKFSLKNHGNHVHSNFHYKDIENLYDKIPRYQRGIKLIRLRHSGIQEIIKDETEDFVGIHIRRGYGITYTEDDLMSLPENVREKYQVFMKKEISIHHLYGFIQDKYYFDIIDEILKINPNQKFFISHDLDYELISYYKDRYGEKIMFKEEVLDAVYDYMDNTGLLKKDFKYGNIVPNIVDLFCLCYCSFLIKSNMSTWSNFAQIYSNLEHVEILEGNESIIKKYKKVFKCTKNGL